ncbi:MAG: hypothetical protein J6T07_06585, partial [Bacteroidales bacterium]|nr:hypothetical protein [Bacteroidales bacterium]
MTRRFFLLPALLLLLGACRNEPRMTPCESQIAAAVAAVDIDSVRTYIDELVAFQTRHTLSSQSDPSRGIGAAVAYLAGRCERW